MSLVTAVVGLAIWDKDYPELKATIKNLSPDFNNTFKTPDEKYQIFYWDFTDLIGFEELESKLKNIRHSLIIITDDGDINVDVKTEDDRGCDEEFYELISWYGGIVINGKKIV